MQSVGEAHLVKLACSRPPEGRRQWTLQLLADRMVVLGQADELSYDSVRRFLKAPQNKNNRAAKAAPTKSLF